MVDIVDHNGAILATDDNDSTLGEDASTHTQTISSSVFNYQEENGRTYHSYRGESLSYWGPNDAQAIEHLDLAHQLFTLTLSGRLYLAPIRPSASEALDLGTGTGIWALAFADLHPACFVTGTDLSPIQPDWVAPNCKFEIDDYNDSWTFGNNKFDFIHLRTSHASVSDRARLYEQCLSSLKPGGYLEEVEYSPDFRSEDNSIAPGSPIAQWNATMRDCASRLPAEELYIYRHMKDHILAAGFENVYEVGYRWPLGPWPKDQAMKELGTWARTHIDLGLENWTLRLLTNFGWKVEDVKTMCAGVRRQMREPGVHVIHQVNIVYGQKPII